MAADKLVRMTAPNGSSVRVSKEKAVGLLARGYTEPKATAKKASPSKSDK